MDRGRSTGRVFRSAQWPVKRPPSVLLYGVSLRPMCTQSHNRCKKIKRCVPYSLYIYSYCEKNSQSIVDRKEKQFRNSKYSKQYKKAYEHRQEKTSRNCRPCDEKGKARTFVDNRKDRRKKKLRSSKNKNTRRYSSLAGKKHCGDVCGCKRSRKVEGHDRLRLQQTRQLKNKKCILVRYVTVLCECRPVD